MPEFSFELSQRIRYRAFVTASSKEEARAKLEATIDEGDGEELDLVETDCSHFEIED